MYVSVRVKYTQRPRRLAVFFSIIIISLISLVKDTILCWLVAESPRMSLIVIVRMFKRLEVDGGGGVWVEVRDWLHLVLLEQIA